jgi:cytidine deaminase
MVCVLGLSCLTNMAAGVLPSSTREVLEVGRGQDALLDVLRRVVRKRRRPRERAGLRGLTASRGRPNAAPTHYSLQGGRGPAHEEREIVTGCNIENASYGLSMCAERVAVFKAVSEGLEEFDAIAVVADSKRLTPPCGPCRQILWEYCGDVLVHMVDLNGRSRTLRLSELLPMPFDDGHL